MSIGWIVIWPQCWKLQNWLETLLFPPLYARTCLDYVISPSLMWLTSLLMNIIHVCGWGMVAATSCASPSHWSQETLKECHIAARVQLVNWQVHQVVVMDGSVLLWQSSFCSRLALRSEPSILTHSLPVCLSNQWWVDRCLCTFFSVFLCSEVYVCGSCLSVVNFLHSFCKIWSFDNRNVEDASFLLCDAVSSNKVVRPRKIVVPLDSLTPCELFDP